MIFIPCSSAPLLYMHSSICTTARHISFSFVDWHYHTNLPIISFPNIRHIVIILSLLLRISKTLSHSSSLTTIPTPPFPVSFLDHHDLHLLPSTPIKRALWPLRRNSCRPQISIFLFLNSSTTFVPLLKRLPMFKVLV